MGSVVMRCLLVVFFTLNSAAVSLAAPAETPPAGLKTVTLDVQNMDCGLCPITVRKALEKVEGVTRAEVDYDTKTATVTFDPSRTGVDALSAASANAGYPASLRRD